MPEIDNNIDKAKVRAAFERAADSYDELASLQHQICDRLATFLPDGNHTSQTRILDAGCGTGYGAELLQHSWPNASIVACDLAPAMVRKTIERGIEATCADIERLPFMEGSFDICWSSLTLQWCRLANAFPELYRVLAPEGVLTFSTLGPGTLHELEFAFEGIDPYRHVHPFSSIDEIKAALAAAGFCDVEITSEVWTTYHPDMKTLLSTIRGIGANHIAGNRRRTFMGKTRWRDAQARYATLRKDAGLPTSYTVIFGTAKKRA